MKRKRSLQITAVLVALLACTGASRLHAEGFALPDHVQVLPVFVVHSDQPLPAGSQKDRLMRRLKWSQRRFREMLSGRDTFQLARTIPDVVRIDRQVDIGRSRHTVLSGHAAAAH